MRKVVWVWSMNKVGTKRDTVFSFHFSEVSCGKGKHKDKGSRGKKANGKKKNEYVGGHDSTAVSAKQT